MWELLDEAATNADRRLLDAAHRRRRHARAADGRRVVDLGDDRDRRRARRPLARLRRRSHPRDDVSASSRPRASTARRAGPRIERRRTELNQAMARIFDPVDGVDFVITAANPDVAFDAEGPLPVGVRRHRGRSGQQRPADVPGQPARQPGDLGSGRFARRPADRTADRRPPLHRAAAARPRPDDGAQPPVATHAPSARDATVERRLAGLR